MKKVYLFVAMAAIGFSSCTENESTSPSLLGDILHTDPDDNPEYYDADGDCPEVIPGGLCCDLDGRILVRPNYDYTYTYGGNTYDSNQNIYTVVKWEVISGSITLLEGQHTRNAKFRFGSKFTTGQIKATGYSSNGEVCGSILTISKL